MVEMSKKRKVAYFLAILLSILYLLWRVFFTIPWHAKPAVLIFALLLVICEIISNSTAYILIYFRLTEKKLPPAPESYLPAATLPAVDLVIVTHNEEPELLRKTINAATFIEYPGQLNIFVADDGDRPAVAELAAAYQVGYIGMQDNHQAKSGNINHALLQLHAPLFAIFDADMIPYSTFLQATVPLFQQNFQDLAADPDHTLPLGFVQTAQSFYNADIFQFNLFSEKIVPNEQDFFSRDVNVLNGSNNHALFTGSNTVFLRQAIDDAGGFPTDTLTEDFELGAKINIAGYSSRSTNKPQASGTTPINLRGVMKQRTRWARGVVHSCRNLHIFLNPKIGFEMRLILMNCYFYWWSFFRRMVYLFAPLLFSLFGIMVVKANFWTLMLTWMPGYFLLHYVLSDTSDKIRDERWGEIQETFFAPYLFIPVMLESLGFHERKFKVTKKTSRTSRRDYLFSWPYYLLWLVHLFAIIKFNYGKYGSEILVGSVITFWLISNFINLSFCLFISMGRQVYRKSERFKRRASGQLHLGPALKVILTHDISEGGLSFAAVSDADEPHLHAGDAVRLTLYHGRTPLDLRGTVTRVQPTDQAPIYSIKTAKMDRTTQNHYLQLVYDGENELLPAEQDTWITVFDELYLNVVMRGRKLQQRLRRRPSSKRSH